MERELALQHIARGEKLAFVRLFQGRAFLCKFRYDTELSDKCRIIPSWQSVYTPDPTGFKKKGFFQGYRIHCLDLPLFEALAFACGYKVEYESTEAIRQIVAEYKDRREWKEKTLIDIPLKRPLREKQVVGAQFLFKAGSALNCDGMGSGKTAQGIGAIKLNEMAGSGFKTLILCPKSVKGAWAKEFRICTEYRVLMLDGNMERRFEQLETLKDYDVVISSYDSFISDYKEIAAAFPCNILIVDEAHRLCNRENKLTQILIGGKTVHETFIDIAKPHSKYLLTGTPLGNELEDLYPLLRLLDKELLNWLGFRARYCLLEEGERWAHPNKAQIAAAAARGEGRPKAAKKGFMSVVGYQNDGELKKRLGHYMIRRTKDESMPERKGKKRFHIIDIELDEEERSVYDALRLEFQADVRGKRIKVDTQLGWMTRAQQVCDSLELLPECSAKKSTKLQMLLSIVKEEAPKRKIVIFSKYKQMTDIIVRELKAMRIPALYLHGDVKDEDRQPLIDEFQEDETYRVFVSTLQAGGVGITLTAATLCILYDRWWAPGANFQAIDRLDRLGQEGIVDVVFLRVKNSVEEYVERKWLDKQDMVINMVGDDEVLKALTDEEKKMLWLSGQDDAYGMADDASLVKKWSEDERAVAV